jgi:hypothetical protein
LRSAAPVYVPNVDDVVLVKAPVPETVLDFVVFREMDVHVGVTLVYFTLDGVVEGPVLVLELVVLEFE